MNNGITLTHATQICCASPQIKSSHRFRQTTHEHTQCFRCDRHTDTCTNTDTNTHTLTSLSTGPRSGTGCAAGDTSCPLAAGLCPSRSATPGGTSGPHTAGATLHRLEPCSPQSADSRTPWRPLCLSKSAPLDATPQEHTHSEVRCFPRHHHRHRQALGAVKSETTVLMIPWWLSASAANSAQITPNAQTRLFRLQPSSKTTLATP